MRAITKGVEPASLTAHRQRPHCNYSNYQDKDALRLALVTEQRMICCYCLSRINAARDKMKIEHWRSRTGYGSEELSYRNLLGACNGGEGQPQRFQHCDSRKGDKDLQWNPADPTHHIETRVRYDFDGTISSDEVTFDTELNDVLNLNLPWLKNNRKGIYAGILDWLRGENNRIHGPVPRERLERERARFAGAGILRPYGPVAVWVLTRKLEGNSP